MKRCKGILLIKLILIIIIAVLMTFLAYKFIHNYGFDTAKIEEQNSIESFANKNVVSKNKVENNSKTTTEVYTPVIDYPTSSTGSTDNSYKHYYYTQLNNEAKIIYDGLENNIENMKSGNYNIDFGKQFNSLLNTSGGEQKLNIAFQSAWNAFIYDYVDIFYIDVTKLILTTKTSSIAGFSTHRVSLSCGSNSNYFADGIKSKDDVYKKQSYVSQIRDEFVSKLSGYSKYEQIKYVHDWLIDNLEYDTTFKGINIYNIYGALSDKKVVCEGYARAFKYILDGLGIENILVSGTATNSTGEVESHAWNYVKLNEKWYAVDVTWDDPIINGGGSLTTKMRYKNFLKGSNTFFGNHKENGYLSENSIKFSFPTIQKEDYNM